MKTLMMASLVLGVVAGVCDAQLVQRDPGPVRPAQPSTVREPARKETPVAKDRFVRVEIDGVEGVIPAVAIDQDFSMGNVSGRRFPQATITVTREPDGYTAALLAAHTRGLRYRNVVITSQIATPSRARLTLRLGDVMVEAVHLRTGADTAEESVTFRFGRIAASYDDDGFEWNYATMSPH